MLSLLFCTNNNNVACVMYEGLLLHSINKRGLVKFNFLIIFGPSLSSDSHKKYSNNQCGGGGRGILN